MKEEEYVDGGTFTSSIYRQMHHMRAPKKKLKSESQSESDYDFRWYMYQIQLQLGTAAVYNQ